MNDQTMVAIECFGYIFAVLCLCWGIFSWIAYIREDLPEKRRRNSFQFYKIRKEIEMKVEKGKIVEATESELFRWYLEKGYDDFMSFNDYIYQMKKLGVKIIYEKR